VLVERELQLLLADQASRDEQLAERPACDCDFRFHETTYRPTAIFLE